MAPLPVQRRIDNRAAGIGLALLAIAAVIVWDTSAQTISSTYGIGPTAMPYIVVVGLIIVGLGHVAVALRAGLPAAEPADIVAIGWIAIGLVALLLCIAFGGGFILATAILFATTARGFGRRAFLTDAAIGLVLGIAIHLLFSKLLTLTLPAGPLERLF